VPDVSSSSSARRTAERSDAPVAACPSCGDSSGEVLLEFPRVPINCSELHWTAARALGAPTGSLRLVLCPACGYVSNQDFDPDALSYDAAYENALDFSPSFREYLDHLATELIDRLDLHGRTVVEIGCGQGSFLAALCRGDGNRGYGFDPGFRADLELPGSVEIATQMFDPALIPVRGDLYCARHVLEHIPEPLEFLRKLRPVVAERGATLYIEVPAGEAVFGGDSSFDLNYPHVSYFSAPALVGLMRSAGFTVDRVDHRFGGQFLSVEARVTDAGSAPVPPAEIARFVDQARSAAASLDERLAAARARIDEARTRERNIALWGAGAKAVTFLALLERRVDAVVDINPRKRGSFVPGSGVAIDQPDALAAYEPEVVFVLNRMYRGEIAEMLAAESVNSEVVVV
jgi:SAM-dependent methyltransferase